MNPFTLQQKNIKEIELSLIRIRSEAQVNLNRAPRKLYLSPNQFEMKLISKSNEAYSKCK